MIIYTNLTGYTVKVRTAKGDINLETGYSMEGVTHVLYPFSKRFKKL